MIVSDKFRWQHDPRQLLSCKQLASRWVTQIEQIPKQVTTAACRVLSRTGNWSTSSDYKPAVSFVQATASWWKCVGKNNANLINRRQICTVWPSPFVKALSCRRRAAERNLPVLSEQAPHCDQHLSHAYEEAIRLDGDGSDSRDSDWLV